MEIVKVTQDDQEEKGLSQSCSPVCNPVHCAPEGKCGPSKP